MGDAAYLEQHAHVFEPAIASAISKLVSERAADPVARLGQLLLHDAAAPRRLELPSTEGGDADQWDLNAWALGTGVHRVVAAALQQAVAHDAPGAALSYLQGVQDRSELQRLLFTSAVSEGIVDLVWAEVQTLQRAGTATSANMASKFAGAIEMSYSGLDTFFGGLEGVVGVPDPHLFEAMEAEHTKKPDALKENYGIMTTSALEFEFVVGEETLPTGSFGLWPAETEDKLPDRSKCRRKVPLSALQAKAEPLNAKLVAARQPELVREEIIAANLYTGPLFVKYNSVLRGLQSTSFFLRNTMVQLCCPADVSGSYQGSALVHQPANGTLSFQEAKASLNKYTTTLHGINSAIIKLGKLTMASKVYRGIAGMALPKEFWETNDFGVRGGVENAFMSTTLERNVAMGYAAGDGTHMGLVIEVQQGMVNRGADVSLLSQYQHEQEILFGPLTGIEVMGTRIDGSVVVVECAFSINLTALTLEEVLGKRRKVVRDMCDQLASRAQQAAEADEWNVLRVDEGDTGAIPRAVALYLDERLMSLARRAPAHYNENAPLGEAITEAVAVAGALKMWADGLHTLLKHTPADALQDEASRGKHQTPGEKYRAPTAAWTLSVGEAATTMLADELARWSEWSGPLVLSRGYTRGAGDYPPAPSDGWLDGISSLIWIARAKGVELRVDLSRMRWGKAPKYQLFNSDLLADLSRALTPNVTALNLSQNNLTNNATNYAGLQHFCAAITGGRLSGLRSLNMAGTDLRDEGGVMVVEALMDLPLETLDFYSGDQGNHLTTKTAVALGSLLTKTKTLTRLSYGYNSLKPAKAAEPFAEGLAANRTLTSLDINNTEFGIKQWPMMADALKAPPLTDLNVSACGLRGAGAGAKLADLLSHSIIGNVDCRYMEPTTEEAELAAAAVIAHTERCCRPGGLPVADMRSGTLTTLTARNVGKLGVLVVAQLLPLQTGLTTLILRGNSLKDDLSKVLAPLEQLSSLTRLDLSETQMDGKMCQVLAEVLPKTQIVALALNGNTKLGDKEGTKGILALAAVLPDTKLVKLSVKLGGFTDGLTEEANVALFKAAKEHGMDRMVGDASAGNPGEQSPVSDGSMQKYPRGLFLD